VSRIKMLVAGALVVAAVVVGTSAAFAKPLSERQWRQQADAVCKQVGKDLDELGSQVAPELGQNDQPSVEQFAAFMDQAGPVFEQALAAIDDLNEPKALKKDVKKFEVATAAAVIRLQADPSLLAGSADPFAKANKIARRLGLKNCA
jgi:hypothetical protein